MITDKDLRLDPTGCHIDVVEILQLAAEAAESGSRRAGLRSDARVTALEDAIAATAGEFLPATTCAICARDSCDSLLSGVGYASVEQTVSSTCSDSAVTGVCLEGVFVSCGVLRTTFGEARAFQDVQRPTVRPERA